MVQTRFLQTNLDAPGVLGGMRAAAGRPDCNVCIRGGCFRAAGDARGERHRERHTSFAGVLVNGKGRLVGGIWTSFDESIPHFSQGTTRLGRVVGFEAQGGWRQGRIQDSG